MASYDVTSMTKKFQVEVAIIHMRSQSSLSCQPLCFKARILYQLVNFKCLYPKVFSVTDNESEIRFSKWLTQYGGSCI